MGVVRLNYHGQQWKQVQHDDWVCSRIENVGQAMPDGFSGLPRHCVARNDNNNVVSFECLKVIYI